MATLSRIRNKVWGIRFSVGGKQKGVFSLHTEDESLALDIKKSVEKRVVQYEHSLAPKCKDPISWILTGRVVEAPPVGVSLLQHIDMYRQYRLKCPIATITKQVEVKRMKYFQQWCVSNKYTSLDNVCLLAYQTYVKSRLTTGDISPVTAKHLLGVIKSMVVWLYECEYIDGMPRFMAKYSKISIPQPVATFFTQDEIRTLLANATPFQSLLIFGGLNMGYTNVDFATLTSAMVDYNDGVIRRNRNKTDIPQHSKMWKETAELLQMFGHSGSDTSIPYLTLNGDALIISKATADKHIYADRIKNEWMKLLRKCKMKDGKHPLKNLRKTGAQYLLSVAPPHICDLYLAHANRMLSAYTTRVWDEMFFWTDKMRDYFLSSGVDIAE